MKFEIIDPDQPEEEKPLRVWLEQNHAGELVLMCADRIGRHCGILQVTEGGTLFRFRVPPTLGLQLGHDGSGRIRLSD